MRTVDQQTPVREIDLDAVADRYIAAWNEADAGRRRRFVERAFTEDARYADPIGTGDGQAGIDALIAAVQTRFPGYRFRRRGEARGFGDRILFSWDLAAAGEPALAGGTDVGVVAPDGRLAEVVGFLDFAPS